MFKFLKSNVQPTETLEEKQERLLKEAKESKGIDAAVLYKEITQIGDLSGKMIAYAWLINNIDEQFYIEEAIQTFDRFMIASNEHKIQEWLKIEIDRAFDKRETPISDTYYEDKGEYLRTSSDPSVSSLSSALISLGSKYKFSGDYFKSELYHAMATFLNDTNAADAAYSTALILEKYVFKYTTTDEIIFYLKISSSHDNQLANLKLMEYSLQGLGDPILPHSYIALLTKLAQSHADLRFKLAWHYQNGKYVTRNIPEAIKLYSSLVDEDPGPMVLCNLAECYEYEGTEKSNLKAINYYTRAAQKGSVLAQTRVAALRQQCRVPVPIMSAEHDEVCQTNYNNIDFRANSPGKIYQYSLSETSPDKQEEKTNSTQTTIDVTYNLDLEQKDIINYYLRSTMATEEKWVPPDNNFIKNEIPKPPSHSPEFYIDLSESPYAIDEDILKTLSDIEKTTNILSIDVLDDQTGKARKIIPHLNTHRFLDRVDFRNNQMDEQSIKALSIALIEHGNLKSVGLSGTNITDYGIYFLAQALEGNRVLEKIDLSHNKISNIGIALLVHALRNNFTLIEMTIDDNPQSMSNILEVLLFRNRRLKAMSSDNNAVNNNRHMIINIINRKIDFLLKGKCALIQPSATPAEIKALNNVEKTSNRVSSPCFLKKDFSKMRAHSISDFVSKLPSSEHLLGLECYGGYLFSHHIADMISNATQLRWLAFYNINLLSPASSFCHAELIAKALKLNTSLIGLSLSGFSFDELTLKAFAEALQHNKTLMYLDMGRLNLTEDLIKLFEKSIEENSMLLELNICNQDGEPIHNLSSVIKSHLARNIFKSQHTAPKRLYSLEYLNNKISKKENQYFDARLLYDSAVKIMRTQPEKALEYFKKSGTQQSLEMIDKIYRDNPKLKLAHNMELAASNNPVGMYELGCYFQEQKDDKTALEWYVKAANQVYFPESNVRNEAIKHSAYKREQLLSTAPAFSELSIIKSDESRKDMISQYHIGTLYLADKDETNALEWFIKSANQKYELAITERDKIFKLNLSLKLKYLLQSDEKDQPTVQFEIGTIYLHYKNFTAAIEYFTAAAAQGNKYAIAEREKLFQSQPELKIPFLMQAANNNDVKAQDELAFLFLELKRQSEAFIWFNNAALHDRAEAYTNLGNCFYQGLGTEIDYFKAADNYQKAAEKKYEQGAALFTKLCREHLFNLLRKEKSRTILDLQHSEIDVSDLLTLSSVLNENLVLSQLDLRNTCITKDDADRFARSLDLRGAELTILHNNGKSVVFKPSSPPNTNLEFHQPAISIDEISIDMPKQFVINYNEIEFKKTLGKGGYGIVSHAIWRKCDVAVKVITGQLQEDIVANFKKEVEIMTQLQSAYLVRLFGICLSPRYSFVMEYMPSGSLTQLLHSDKPFDWPMQYRIATDIAYGLLYLHHENIEHRDIKSANVLLTKDGETYRAKLSDFGLSKAKDAASSSISSSGGVVGTTPWMAPELFEEKGSHTKKSDIYSFGLTLWEIVSRKRPFAEVKNVYAIPPLIIAGHREVIPESCPASMADLIKSCWNTKPAERPTIQSVVETLDKMKNEEEILNPEYIDNLASFRLK